MDFDWDRTGTMASTLMFWNKQNSNSSNNNGSSNGNSGTGSHNGSDAKNTKNGRNWLHAPDVLVNGHVAYLVKFLGSTPVEQAKGIEVVKEAIRRLQFTQQMKKAEGGSNVKTKKVEITVSVDGVAIQEPRTQTILHQFPLHKISYCADEKGVKKFFSFIAKTSPATGGNGSLSAASDDTHSSHSRDLEQDGQQHECFVFVSSKLASDITLTIGQAFDLAYRRYVNDSGKTVEASKLQSQNKQLENAVTVYRQRLRDLSELVSKPDLDKLLLRLGLRDICEMPPALENGVDHHHNNHNSHNHMAAMNGNKTPDLGIDVSLPNNDDQLLIETSPKHFAPIVPPRNIQNQINSTLEAFKPSVGTKMEGLLLNSDSDSDFDPRAPDNDSQMGGGGGGVGMLLGGNKISNDLFGFEPPKQSSMGQQLFSNGSSNGSNNNHTSFTNGNNGITSNGFGAPTSPPPMLAPPPQKSAPRRTTSAHQNNNNNNNNNMTNGNGYQDLFGSAPFNPQTADDTTPRFDSSFDATGLSASSFTEELKTLADNSSKLDSVLALNSSLYKTPPPAVTSSPNGATKTNPFAAFAGPAVAKLRSANPLATAASKLNTATYDMFQNTTSDTDQLTGSSSSASTSGVSCSSGLSSFGTSANNSAAPNYHVSSHQHQQQLSSSTTEAPDASDALFQDFALSAFNEFKRDLSNSNQRRAGAGGGVGAENNSKLRLSSTMVVPGGGKSAGELINHHHQHAGARLIPEKTTSKNGLFSTDDLLDTFDPLK